MSQRTLDGRDLTALREAYLRVVTERLPERAREAGDWPIRDDHCFGRVVLDNTFGGVWDEHVTGSPAYEQLTPAELETALELAERMLTEGTPAVVELNDRSLRWRERDD